MDRPVVAVVLAGGTGSRLYPASRSDRPKQFLPLVGEQSLLAATVDRAGFADEVLVSTAPAYAADVPEHAPDAEVVVEPAAKDTGPALLYATHRARGAADHDDPVVVCLPADHHVPDGDAFADAMRRGARVAADTGALVTFGVTPTRPDPGYGYIERGDEREDERVDAYDLAAFHEKPDADTAGEYVSRGYLWNAGIFAWTPSALFAAARDTPLAPLADALRPADAADGSATNAAGAERAVVDTDAGDTAAAAVDTVDTDAVVAGFDAVDAVSIDYAVLERVDDAVVVPADFAWDDLGSWDALERVLPQDCDGNTLAADAVTVDAAGNVVAGDKHVSLVGVDDLCVVAVDDRVLVVPKADAQRVREVVAELKRTGDF
ncbi:mannose-1-phosphate guanylyltransferase [Halobaculum sp. P14]|uniref:mannose-1-phosphate guanylyltransferase n=1 Tax=Halobaculum sp. P14 TaxID=3421638 RepID=UPI003EBEFC31